MDSLEGKLLVASPELSDPNFHRTIVLIVQHNEQGAFGVVLNRRSERTVREIWEEIGESPCHSREPVRLGGPVVGPLMALHTQSEHSEKDVVPGVHFATSKEQLCQLVAGDTQPLRLFCGYSGWAEGQLEGELEAGAWLVTDATYQFIFHDEDDELWQRVAKHIVDDVLFSTLDIKHAPSDPSLN